MHNIQQIKLGAPSRIVGGAAPNADLTVQVMRDCEELTLKDGTGKCTKDGALTTAARLLKQKATEDVGSQSWYTPSGEEKPIKVDVQSVGTSELTSAEIDGIHALLAKYTGDSNIIGTAHAGGSYEEVINALKQRFPNLNITADKLYILFKDPEVLMVLMKNNIGDVSGITKTQLAAVTDIGNWFKGNTNITSFDELSKTNVTSLLTDAFSNCSNLVAKSAFFNIKSCGSGSLYGLNSTKFMFLPSFEESRDARISNKKVDFGKNATNLSATRILYIDKYERAEIVIVRSVGDIAISPSFCLNGWTAGYGINNLFVPSSMVDYWKANYTYATNTCAIGGEEWQSTMKTLAAEEGFVKPDNIGWDYEYIDYLIYGCEPPAE